MSSLLRSAFTVAAGTYAAICAVTYAAQRFIIYPAPAVLRNPTTVARRVNLPGGNRSGSFYLRYDNHHGGGKGKDIGKGIGKGTDRPIVVYFHGNGEQVGDLGALADTFSEMGLQTCMVEYPGYPGTTGSSSETHLLQAAEAALLDLIDSGVPAHNIILMGQSIGTGVAVAMAARGWGVKLVLISPYTSLVDVAKRLTKSVLPVKLLLKDQFDSRALVSKVNIPTLIIHGLHDTLIPQSMGLELADTLQDVKFVSVPTGHNDIWSHPHVTESIRRFLEASSPPRTPCGG